MRASTKERVRKEKKSMEKPVGREKGVSESLRISLHHPYPVVSGMFIKILIEQC
jgi:hypothetical protein